MVGPLHTLQLPLGARMERYGEWELPADYGDPIAEHRAVRESVGLLERAPRAFICVSGSDRFSWMQGMVSNDVRILESGVTSIQSCALDSTGHLLADLTIVSFGDYLVLDMDRINGEKVYQLLDQFLIVEDVDLAPESDLFCLSLQGPDVTEKAVRGWAESESGTLAVPADHTGEGGFDLYVRGESGIQQLWLTIVESGIRPVGESAAEILRIEAGIPRYGVDMDETTIALEAGLENSHISHTKGCYVGQEIIHRIHSRGHTNRALTGFFVDGDGPPPPKEKLYSTDSDSAREVGWITSGIFYSPTLQRTIAMGYLRHELREEGTVLRTETGLSLTVTELPFYGQRDK